jgi:S1-C subfamily serine protease
MARILMTLLFAFSLLVSTFAASTWTSAVEKLEGAVAFVEIIDTAGERVGSCTGFGINTAKHYVQTAAHCDGAKILVDGTTAYKVYKDERKDLMVYRASGVDLSALALAKDVPDILDEVVNAGFGYGFEKPLFRLTHISQRKLDIKGLSGPYIVTDTTFISGQSGGPVVNQRGEVVAIVQMGDSGGLGLGVDATVIRDRIGKYYEVK